MNLFSIACDAFGLTISIKKTKVMFTPVPGAPYVEPDIFVKKTRLEVVDTFVYLGSTISRDGSLDAEINLRTQKASTAFGKLEKRVWSDRGITIKTKISVYSTCILTALLYSSECWTTHNKNQCPLDNKCLTSSIIYNAQVTTNSAIKNYIGLTEGTFKQRFSQRKATFKHRKYANSTELSKYNNQDFNIKWTIISRARLYNNISKRCDLCLTEKLMIITANPDRTLNKRSELISKCRHEKKFYLGNN